MWATPRLSLREFTPEDFAASHAFTSLPEVCQFEDWGPHTEAETAEWLAHALSSAAEVPRTTWILAVVAGETLIGAASLEVEPRHHSGAFGCVFHPDVWGRGYGTEVCLELLRFGFEDLRLHRMTATCREENTASIRGLEAMGLTLEGRMRQDRFLGGRFVDSRLYAKIAGS